MRAALGGLAVAALLCDCAAIAAEYRKVDEQPPPGESQQGKFLDKDDL